MWGGAAWVAGVGGVGRALIRDAVTTLYRFSVMLDEKLFYFCFCRRQCQLRVWAIHIHHLLYGLLIFHKFKLWRTPASLNRHSAFLRGRSNLGRSEAWIFFKFKGDAIEDQMKANGGRCDVCVSYRSGY